MTSPTDCEFRATRPIAPVPPGAGLRIVIVSDALPGRNGVDGYYHDLTGCLSTHVAAIGLVNPDPANGHGRSWFSVPMPGDTTQRICFPALVKVYREIMALRPNLILIPAPGPFGLLGAFVARRLKIPMIAGLHTDLEGLADLYWNRFLGRIARHSIEAASRQLFQRADAVVVNSNPLLPAARRLGAKRVRLLGTPLAEAFVATTVTPPSGASTRVAFAGRLAPEKNIAAIIAAAERLPRLSFTLAGRGPLETLLRRKSIQLPNLNYAGHLNREGVVRLFDDSDVVILPSRVEAFGTVALEAMSRARLVLVSSACGITIWPQLSAGLLIMTEHESVAEALKRIDALEGATRTRKATTAFHSALEFHRNTVRGWLELLTAGARA